MQGTDTYERSLNHLKDIRKNLYLTKVEIDFDKLDDQSKGKIREALVNAVSERTRAVEKVVLGAR